MHEKYVRLTNPIIKLLHTLHCRSLFLYTELEQILALILEPSARCQSIFVDRRWSKSTNN